MKLQLIPIGIDTADVVFKLIPVPEPEPVESDASRRSFDGYDCCPKHTFMFNNVSTQVYHANKGEGLPRHEHTVPHISIAMWHRPLRF